MNKTETESLKWIDDEKMSVLSDSGIVNIPHLKHCGRFMRMVPCVTEDMITTYSLTEKGTCGDELTLANIIERHPQYFECPMCGKKLIRKYIWAFVYVPFYMDISPYTFTAVADDIKKRISWEQLVDILLRAKKERV